MYPFLENAPFTKYKREKITVLDGHSALAKGIPELR